jgi:ubiquinone/menaquinone biosynthesis C-methylase UbiE
MGEVDLDRLASGYDHRTADTWFPNRAAMAVERSGLGPGMVAVDIGGGRGQHSEVFTETGARVVLVDRSPAMVEAAVSRGLEAVIGDATALPLGDDVADLAYFHLSIHYGSPVAMLGEAARVLRPGGVAWVWTLDDHHPASSFLTRWFPSVEAIDSARFPLVGDIAAAMSKAGLEQVGVVRRTEHVTRRAGSWERAVRAGFVSTLHLVPDDEIASGLDRFRRAHPDPNQMIDYDLPFVGVHGTGPSLLS